MPSDHNAVNFYYHEDAFGNVQAITDGEGTVLINYTTDAWGNILCANGNDERTEITNRNNPFVFEGGLNYWRESELGLTYVRARWLDTATGQWLSVDPVEGQPRYSYVDNKPTTNSDPDGLDRDPSVLKP